jgi:hypothetical protein
MCTKKAALRETQIAGRYVRLHEYKSGPLGNSRSNVISITVLGDRVSYCRQNSRSIQMSRHSLNPLCSNCTQDLIRDCPETLRADTNHP